MVFHIAYFGTKYFSGAYAITLVRIGEVKSGSSRRRRRKKKQCAIWGNNTQVCDLEHSFEKGSS